jgi:type II secretory pathway predicted ATPase ExeA
LVKTFLEKMTRQDMENALLWRFEQAGGSHFPFDKASLDTLYERSTGNPRTICGMAQLALEYTAVTGQPITPKIIQDVAERRYV